MALQVLFILKHIKFQMKKIVLLFLVLGLTAFMHMMLLYGKEVSAYDFREPLVLKSFGISIFSILLIGVLIWFQNRNKSK